METLSNNILKNRGIRDITSTKDLLFYQSPTARQILKKIFWSKFLITKPILETKCYRLVFEFIDKALFLSKDFSITQKSKFIEFTKNRLISIFPIKFINLFDKDFDKQKYIISNGSLIEGIHYGNFQGGLFNTGSLLAELIIITDSI